MAEGNLTEVVAFKLRPGRGKGFGGTAFQAESSVCAKGLRLERNLACSKRLKGDRWLDNREGGERGWEMR